MRQSTHPTEALELFRARSDIPVILCTGFNEKTDEKAAPEAGAASYMEKPLKMRELAVKVRNVLDATRVHEKTAFRR